MNLIKRGTVAAAALLACLAWKATADMAADFVLVERLGHAWSNECVTFELKPDQVKAARQGKALAGAGGHETAFQLIETGGVARIAFQADLAPYTSASYSFTEAASRKSTDLDVSESGDVLRLANSRTGIELRRKLKPGEGPIARIRLGSGTWTGGSTLEGSGAISDYQVEVLAKGPVFAEAICRATFADGGAWRLRFRIERAEPVVLVEEQFDAPSGGVFRLAMGDKAYQPTHLMHRNADVTSSALMADPIAGYFLEPWLHWSNPRHGNWIALFTPTPVTPVKMAAPDINAGKDNGVDELVDDMAKKPRDPNPDMLMVGLVKPSLWRDPQWKGRAPQIDPNVQASVKEGVLVLELPVRGGNRAWMLGALDKAGSAEMLARQNRRVAPPPHQLLIKHGDFPLEKVKDFVLEWKGDEDNHPVLYIKKQDLPALRARLKSDPKELNRWTSQQPIDKYFLDGPIKEFIASGDLKLGRLMVAKAEEYLQICVDLYLKQDERQTPGAAPHMQSLIVTVINLMDPLLSTEAVTPEARKRILAKLAFLGYVVSSSDYWSPERGFSGFANMTSIVALYRTGLGCMLPSHPHAKGWAKQGLDQLYWQLGAWSDEDGGWLEAPHYAMVSFDHMLAGFTMAANAGYSEYAFDPRMRKVIEWFAGISTPRDSRTGGFRHQPPIGNTYHGEPTGLYGLAAALWKERDPDFASRMQWMYEQNGSFGGLGIGWNFPAMLGYGFLMNQSGVTSKPAGLGSMWFRQTGVVLRNTMDSRRETYLHMIAGSNHDHYDFDSGSIILYGKGRILADDWGYIGRHPEQWHSMLTSPSAWSGGEMRVDAFAPGVALDYVSGRKGSWQRQIAFVKDANPETGPAFFLIRDTQSANEPSTWRLWLTALKPPVQPAAATPPPVDVAASLAGGVEGLKKAGGQDDSLTEGFEAKKKPVAAAPAGPGVVIHSAGATLIGGEDVDLDIFIFKAEKLGLKKETATQRVSCGYRNGVVDSMENTQTCLIGSLAGRGAVSTLLYPRLKTEPVPKVTWFADGRGAEVTTAAGTDVVFLNQKRQRTVDPDGKSLLPLFGVDRLSGKGAGLLYKPADGDSPHFTVNTSGTDRVEGTYRIPAQSVSLHPGPTNPATAVWRSPVSGTVSVEARLADANVGGGDGIAYELRQATKVLAQGVMTNGGDTVVKVDAAPVAKGELLRLVILPRESNWWDGTIVDMTVRQSGGPQWNLRESSLRGNELGNERTGKSETPVWWVCEGDAEAFDPKVFAQPVETYGPTSGAISFQGTAGAVQVRGPSRVLTLGASGEIQVGGKAFRSEGPATRTESSGNR
jgi:hypothetical protein